MLTRWRVVVIIIDLYVQLTLQVKVARLYPDRTLFGEALHHQQSKYYLLSDLKPNSSYELRVSYPATTPTDFLISIVEAEKDPVSRKLLNIEKLIFENNPSTLERVAKVTAMRTGVPRNAERLSDPVLYNIVLETLYLGLPLEVWKMAGIILVLVAFVVKFAVPWTVDYLDKQCAMVKQARD